MNGWPAQSAHLEFRTEIPSLSVFVVPFESPSFSCSSATATSRMRRPPCARRLATTQDPPLDRSKAGSRSLQECPSSKRESRAKRRKKCHGEWNKTVARLDSSGASPVHYIRSFPQGRLHVLLEHPLPSSPLLPPFSYTSHPSKTEERSDRVSLIVRKSTHMPRQTVSWLAPPGWYLFPLSPAVSTSSCIPCEGTRPLARTTPVHALA